MLVLCRKEGQRLLLGEGIVLTVLGLNRGRVRLGIEAPENVFIRREELQSGNRKTTPAEKKPT